MDDKQVYKAVSDTINILETARARAYGQPVTKMRIEFREHDGFTFPEVWGSMKDRFVKFPLGQAKAGGIYPRDTDRWQYWDKNKAVLWELGENGWKQAEARPAPVPSHPAPAPAPNGADPFAEEMAGEPTRSYVMPDDPDDELPF
jgi:hypothetical protein